MADVSLSPSLSDFAVLLGVVMPRADDILGVGLVA
jgi:hypothetical protein